MSFNNPKNVGICDIEVYWPKLYVKQSDLEQHDNCPGKYISGLGQFEMSICSKLEDSVSMALTVVHRLMEKSSVKYVDIGRIDVGTESQVDLSKSIKSHILSLFKASYNYSIEGADNINACYGGTAALFNCLNWVHSPSWDGRYGLVVMSDIAEYSDEFPSARATGGASSICLLIGPNAVLPIEPYRGHYMTDCYDFYKPRSLSYPMFDSKLSISSYITCLLGSCQDYLSKLASSGNTIQLYENFFGFHCPYSRLPQKAFYYLHDNIKNNISRDRLNQTIETVNSMLLDSKLNNERISYEKDIEKNYSNDCSRVLLPSLYLSRRIGNSYCCALYLCLISILATIDVDDLIHKRIILYSYGSGSLSSMFSIKIDQKSQELTQLCQNMKKRIEDLDSRVSITPQQMIDLRSDSKPVNGTKSEHEHACNDLNKWLSPNTFYLENIDNLFRRHYQLYK